MRILITFFIIIVGINDSFSCTLEVKDLVTQEVKFYQPVRFPFKVPMKSSWNCLVRIVRQKKGNNYYVTCENGNLNAMGDPTYGVNDTSSLTVGNHKKRKSISLTLQKCE